MVAHLPRPPTNQTLTTKGLLRAQVYIWEIFTKIRKFSARMQQIKKSAFVLSHLQNSFAATFVVWARTMGQREQAVARSLWNKRKANKRTLPVLVSSSCSRANFSQGHSRLSLHLLRWNFNRFLDLFLSLAFSYQRTKLQMPITTTVARAFDIIPLFVPKASLFSWAKSQRLVNGETKQLIIQKTIILMT